jgi:hypothetical protein
MPFDTHPKSNGYFAVRTWPALAGLRLRIGGHGWSGGGGLQSKAYCEPILLSIDLHSEVWELLARERPHSAGRTNLLRTAENRSVSPRGVRHMSVCGERDDSQPVVGDGE